MKTSSLLALATLVGCGGQTIEPTIDDAATDGALDTAEVTEACVEAKPPVTLDCRRGVCPEFTVSGDVPAPAIPGTFFFGFADPSLRQDQVSKRLWVAYSNPHVTTLGTAQVNTVESHLAHSDDLGETFTFDAVLWKTTEALDPAGSGQNGFFDSETVSLTQEGPESWYSVRLRYWVKGVTGFAPDARTFTLDVAHASTPTALGASKEQRLGSTYTRAGLSDVNLNALSPSLANCSFWNDPVVFFDAGKLYLAAECLVYPPGSTTPDDSKEKIVVFSTVPGADVTKNTWRYVGVLADHTIATELGDQQLMQIDLVRGVDGKLLALMTPSHSNAKGTQIHKGCRAVELDSLDPPVLTRQCGKLVVRASATASDIPAGTGSCGYDPASKSGLLLARRADGTPGTGFTIQRTGLRF